MCDKAVDKHAQALEFVPDCCKAQEMWLKAHEDGNTYPSIMQFVPECY